MTSRRRRKAEDLRAAIIEAAGKEFRERGYDGATTAAIARGADVTEAQLFRYFPSKADLFREAVFEPIDRHLLEFIRQQQADLSYGDASVQYVDQLQAFIRQNSAALLSVFSAQRFDRAVPTAVTPMESLQRYFDHGAAMLEARPGGSPMDPQLAVRIAFASVLGAVLFRDWIFSGPQWREKEISAALNQFILNSTAPLDEA